MSFTPTGRITPPRIERSMSHDDAATDYEAEASFPSADGDAPEKQEEELEPVFFVPSLTQDLSKIDEHRREVQRFRSGSASGAYGDIVDAGEDGGGPADDPGAAAAAEADFEQRILRLFKLDGFNDAVDDHRAQEVEAYIEDIGKTFVEAPFVNTPDVTCEQIAARFTASALPEDLQDTSDYFTGLMKSVVEDSIHTSSPLLVGHMTSALPYYIRPLAKLIVSLNQNVVKTETAKTVTFLEREALAQVHKIIYNLEDAFYAEHVQNVDVMLGLFTSGGTMANVTALWIARNSQLGPSHAGSGESLNIQNENSGGAGSESKDAAVAPGDAAAAKVFEGVEKEGLPRALRHYGYEDAIVLGSANVHYSLNKAVDLLGLGNNGIVKIPVDDDYRVDLELLEAKIVEARANKVMILALVGICGATETGAIDPLEEMGLLAKKYGIHYHIDAAWGGPCIFSESQVVKARGIEMADTVTLDGHKQLYMPMGSGLLFMRDPKLSHSVRKTANYIIRKESYDLGKFTIEGSRPANAMFLHANLNILGVRGFRVLVDKTVRIAQYMARCILRSANFELLVKPMTNILLYRWVPDEFRVKCFEGTLTAEENKVIDGCNVRLQDMQKNLGKTFVSRTTIKCPKYDHLPVVGLRVVIGNPLTEEKDIDYVFQDQADILDSGIVYDDVGNKGTALVARDEQAATYGSVAGTDEEGLFWHDRWEAMTARERFLFRDNEETFFQALVTPNCYLGRTFESNPEAGELIKVMSEANLIL